MHTYVERGSKFHAKLQSNFTEITLRYGCSLVNLLHIFRTPFVKNTSEKLLLDFPSYGSELRKKFTVRLLLMCLEEGRKGNFCS